jgi:hypothetical protein
MDITGLQKAVDKLTNEAVPALTGAVEKLIESADKHIDEDLVQIIASLNGLALTVVNDLHCLLDRLNGSTITHTFNIPPRV